MNCNSQRKKFEDDTLPRATADVAISRTKLSPPTPGAAKVNGLVPKTTYTSSD